MNTIDEKVTNTLEKIREEKRSFEEMMKLIKKYPLKYPIQFNHHPSKWELEKPLPFPY